MRWGRIAVAVAVGLVVMLAVLSAYYRLRVGRDGVCIVTDGDGQVKAWQFGECP